MKVRLTLGGMTMLFGAILIGQLHAREDPPGRMPNASPISIRRIPVVVSSPPVSELDKTLGLTGADIIVSHLFSINKDGTVGSITGYSISTTSCNLGDVEAEWVILGNSNKHPLIGQNIYRYLNGRMEQIGMSWLKHAFAALDEVERLLGYRELELGRHGVKVVPGRDQLRRRGRRQQRHRGQRQGPRRGFCAGE